MNWKDFWNAGPKYCTDDYIVDNINDELRQQVQKTLFDNLMKTKTPQEKEETKKRMMYKTCGDWKTREDK